MAVENPREWRGAAQFELYLQSRDADTHHPRANMHRLYVYSLCARIAAAAAATHTLGSFKSRCTAVYIVWRWCTFPNVIIFARGIARAFVTSAPRARVFLSIPFFPSIVVGIRGVVVAVVADFLVSMLTHSTRVGRMNKKEREGEE